MPRNAILRYSLIAVAGAISFVLVIVALHVRENRSLSAVAHLASLDVDYLTLPDVLRKISPVGRDFGVTSSGVVLLQSANGLTAVDTGGPSDFSGGHTVPDSFAIDVNDRMLTIAGGFLGVLDESGDPVPGVPLPYDDARLAPSAQAGAVYLFGGREGDFRLYRFIEDGSYQVLLTSSEPIVAAADSESKVYAATAGAIYVLDPGGGPSSVLFTAPADDGWGPIQSLAVGSDGLVFFSTPSRVYALAGGEALSIVNDSGGTLRTRDGKLYVLDQTRGLLYTLSPATAQMFGER